MPIRHTILLLLLTFGSLTAQEINYIDLTFVSQRTDLRHPPAPPPVCKDGTCAGGGFGGVGIACGAPDVRDPHALAVQLLRVTPADIDPAVPFEAEFRVLNSGLAPIKLPVSPHLSDLQSSDESATFSYFSLALVVRVQSDSQQPVVSPVGFVYLYGSPDHEGTMQELKPGEWIRVRANVKLNSGPTEPASVRFQGEFWLRTTTYHPHPGGSSSDIVNLYPNATPTPPIPGTLTVRRPIRRAVRPSDPAATRDAPATNPLQ
jgi:hypothetical protein